MFQSFLLAKRLFEESLQNHIIAVFSKFCRESLSLEKSCLDMILSRKRICPSATHMCSIWSDRQILGIVVFKKLRKISLTNTNYFVYSE